MSDHCHNNGSSPEGPQNGSHHLTSVPEAPCLQPLQALTYPSDSLVLHSSPLGTPVCKAYPSPVAKHEEVVANGSLFLETLGKFHATVGTKFMVPIIGGKELDLHLLYVEVTSRGGLQQVIKDRKWKDITAVFNFPPTATNASFVLRKYYISLLYHYEQVYFFGAQGQPIPPPAALPAPSPVSHSKNITESANSPSDEAKSLPKKRKRVDPMSSMGHPVTGVIDGKFENAYLITVMVGSEKLRGVLYEMPAGFSGEQIVQVPNTNNSNNYDTTSGVRPRRRRRRKDEMRKRDPDHPKPNRSGYNFFFAEQHTKLKALHPGKDREISKMIGDSWNKLTEEAKAVYQELGLKDKERYKSEMEQYRERQKSHSQDKGILVSRNEGSNQGLENHIKMQFQDQGVPHTRTEGSNQGSNQGLEMQFQDQGVPHIRTEGSNQGLENHFKMQFQDQGVPHIRTEGSNQGLENRIKMQFQDQGVPHTRTEGSNQGLENHIKMQFQDQGVPHTRTEGSNQQLDNNSELLKHQPDSSLSLQVGMQGNRFKVAQLSDMSGMVGVGMSIKKESLVGTKVSTEQENNQGSDCTNLVLEL